MVHRNSSETCAEDHGPTTRETTSSTPRTADHMYVNVMMVRTNKELTVKVLQHLATMWTCSERKIVNRTNPVRFCGYMRSWNS